MRVSSFIILLLFPWVCIAQSGEFRVYENGLIYSPVTMSRLGYIVDSLNLKFRQCELRPHRSLEQGLATFVELNSGIRKQILAGGSYDAVVKSHARHVKVRNVWIIKSRSIDYDGNAVIEYETMPSDEGVSVTVPDVVENDKTSGWIVGKEHAVYVHQLQSTLLADEYAKLVMYVDCMIDTTATIYTVDDARFEWKEPGPIMTAFLEEVNNAPDRPEYPDSDKYEGQIWDSLYAIYLPKYRMWDSLRLQRLDYRMKEDSSLCQLLLDAKAEAMADTTADEILEFYVERYLSGEEALALKRSRRVMGFCSMDSRPRKHALDICRLSAETAKWEIFLRSHLDIMNDRFDRVSDGSWAWEGRKTYLKELEELDIEAVDLLLGTCLRVDDAADNHYWGSISRIGRALTEVSDKNALEQKLQDMICDEKLDAYNRLLLTYLYSHYTYNLADEERKVSNIKLLRSTAKMLPSEVRKYWRD